MKKKINNSEELNNYYNIVNLKLKKYSDMNIQPHKVAKYLKPGSENFFRFINEDDELKDVDGIEIVLKDIIEDTYAAFKDGLFNKIKRGNIKTFESYLFESIINNEEISEEEIHKHERALADIYKISISYIDCIDKKLHLYTVKDDGVIYKVIVYNEEQLKSEREIVSNQLFNLYIKKVNTIELPIESQVDISDIIDMKILKEEYLKWLETNLKNEEVIEAITKVDKSLDVSFKSKVELNGNLYYLFEVI